MNETRNETNHTLGHCAARQAVYRTSMEIPELADLIWLFEDEPTAKHPDLAWPDGLQSFRLERGDRTVLFSLDPLAGEAYITLHASEREIASVGRLRKVETLTIVKRDGYEGLELRFVGGKHDPLFLQTRPEIRLHWDVTPLGTW